MQSLWNVCFQRELSVVLSERLLQANSRKSVAFNAVALALFHRAFGDLYLSTFLFQFIPVICIELQSTKSILAHEKDVNSQLRSNFLWRL